MNEPTPRVRELINGIIDREGGFVDDSLDLGGPTRWGITERAARRDGYTGPMRELSRRRAFSIYLKRYWRDPGFDLVADHSSAVAEEMADTGVNMGPGDAARFLQRALNALNDRARLYPDVAVDGKIGPRSLEALAGFLAARSADGETVLVRALNCLQGAEYIRLAEVREKNERFVYGWLRTRVG